LSNISSYLQELKHFPIYTIIAREFFLFYSYLKLFELLAEPVVFGIQKTGSPPAACSVLFGPYLDITACCDIVLGIERRYLQWLLEGLKIEQPKAIRDGKPGALY